MAQSKVLHYASYEAPHEGDNCEYWLLTACGHDYENITQYEDCVTCKNCLREINKSNKTPMTPNDKLPEEISKQIKKEAKEYVKQFSTATSEVDYIAGATAWAGWKIKHDLVKSSERAVSRAYAQALIDRGELKTVLQEFVSNHEAGLLPNRFVYEKAIKILNDGK